MVLQEVVPLSEHAEVVKERMVRAARVFEAANMLSVCVCVCVKCEV